MNVPLPAAFDVAVSKPIDSRLFVENFSDLNNIFNKYVGLTCYVNGENHLYVYNGSFWEKVLGENIDYVNIINSSFSILPEYNAKVIFVDNSNNIQISFLNNISLFPNGFNVTVVQINNGSIQFLSSTGFNILNKYSRYKTSGRYSVVSILRVEGTNNFLLYGDLSE